MNTFETQVLALVREELGAAPHDVGLDTALAELGDSLMWVSLLGAVEEAFDITIGMEQGLALVTVRDLVRLVGEPALA